uniref:SET domain-containing protein n=1 Tax=Attheya septentrionalis TaxID=420275 RepID=A0A7S2XS51_9STRA|mmetsp:Transcript_6626/g.11924  ORF Transcript_6626/g.11924 Transcript_6626/m.11924 type:complete len:557 (+) Transcript_6626:614-2284(+)
MLAKSHTGLVNVDLLRPYTVDGSCRDLAHCRHGPDAGAATPYHGKESLANGDMEAGMELFVEYGDEWFADREWKFGVLPLSDDFLDADELIQDFYETHKTAFQTIHDDHDIMTNLQDRWDGILMNQKDEDEGLVMALPTDVRDMDEVRQTGSARHSVPNVVRSLEWLDEHGICLDNIEPKMSSSVVGQRGAFATRSLREGQVIAPAPLVHMQRHFLHLYQEERDKSDPQLVSDQLLLNYCYGHANSSLVFFPYAPIVNYINHSPTVPNAKIRWSQHSSYEHANWTHTDHKSVDDIMKHDAAALLMEFVATRDIGKGEEILIDYGPKWQDAWNTHVQQWTTPSDAETFFPAAYWNENESLILTSKEQIEHPYPSNVVLLCFLQRKIQEMYRVDNSTTIGPQYIWEPHDDDHEVMDGMGNAKKCEILKRSVRRNDGDDDERSYYGVRVFGKEDRSWIVAGLPREFVEFYDKPYTSNQHLRHAFRHEITSREPRNVWTVSRRVINSQRRIWFIYRQGHFKWRRHFLSRPCHSGGTQQWGQQCRIVGSIFLGCQQNGCLK